MHIVILDDVALSDEQTVRLHSLGTVSTHTDAPKDAAEIVSRLKDADIALIAWAELDAAILDQLPHLKMISIWQSGHHYVDVVHAAQKGIVVTNVPGYAGTAVAELTLGLMLSLARCIIPANEATHQGDYSWQRFEGTELRGKTLGVIGVGNIGSQVITLAKGFGMKVIANTLHPSSRRADQLGVRLIELDELLQQSDFVTLQVPLNDRTLHLISEHAFSLMKPSAYFVSSTRGDVVDYTALRAALQNNTIAGAALDTMLVSEQSLTELPNLIVTPRIGSYATEALARKGDICITNIEQFLAGDPTNAVH